MKKKIMFIFDHTEEIILVVLFAILVVITFLQVVMRYVFNNSLSWTEELGKYTYVWLSWIGISIGAKMGEHIKIESLLKAMPYRTAQIFNVISELIVVMICGVTLYYGLVMDEMLTRLNIRNVALGINQVWGAAAVPVGCGLMIFRCIQSISASVHNIKRGTPLPVEIDLQKEGNI